MQLLYDMYGNKETEESQSPRGHNRGTPREISGVNETRQSIEGDLQLDIKINQSKEFEMQGLVSGRTKNTLSNSNRVKVSE